MNRVRQYRRRAVWVAAAGLLLATRLPQAADDPGLAAGKALFLGGAQPACGICHTLKDAGSDGAIGPDLNELKPDAARVAKAVKNGIGQMPAFSALTEAEVEALSRYVAVASGGTR